MNFTFCGDDLFHQKLSHSNSNKRKRGYNSASDPEGDGEESEKRRKFLERNRYHIIVMLYTLPT